MDPTKADWSGGTQAALQPFTDAVLAEFSPKRVMFGSDWPVLGLAASYTHGTDVVRSSFSDISAEEQQRILAGTAIEPYGL